MRKADARDVNSPGQEEIRNYLRGSGPLWNQKRISQLLCGCLTHGLLVSRNMDCEGLDTDTTVEQ